MKVFSFETGSFAKVLLPVIFFAAAASVCPQSADPTTLGEGDQLSTSDPVCSYFTRQGEGLNPFFTPPSQDNGGRTAAHNLGTADRLMSLTRRVTPELGAQFVPPGGGRT